MDDSLSFLSEYISVWGWHVSGLLSILLGLILSLLSDNIISLSIGIVIFMGGFFLEAKSYYLRNNLIEKWGTKKERE